MKLYEIELIALADIKPDKNNARTHSEKQIKQIVKSIKEFGFTNPILVDDKNKLIAGHGRLIAAEILEMEKVPSIVLTGLTKKQKRAYMIADNQIALNSGWDFDMLQIELKALEGFDIELLGFDQKFTDGMLGLGDFSGFADKNQELDLDGFSDLMELKLKFPSEQYETVRMKLNEFGDTPENALLAVLGI